ncbi:MAG: IS21 family transposase [Prevotella sp.]|nr:IS21 family transposase [Prevotella sp.]
MPYQSTQFNKYYNDFIARKNATMHLNHKPGKIMQVDWAGDTASIIDTDTGNPIPAYVFVATLPYSGYSYVEAFLSMNQECWITAHVNAYKFFGGVTRIIQCDNLKTGVDKHGKDEVILNKTYQELSEHYNTAVIPARVRAPKDKAMVEGTVGVISTFILAALRNGRFFSLSELNEAIWERLSLFNSKPFQKKDGSRSTMFEEEKYYLLPLPSRHYEMSTWKVATVSPNYHISVDKMNYSVPYEYIRQKVDVRLTTKTVEVFFEGNRICSHIRLYGRPEQYSTVDSHMPPEHQQYIKWNGERFIEQAAKIGNSTETVIKAVLSGYKTEQLGYKTCMSILRLADKYSVERLENACRKALNYTPRPCLKNIKAILSSGQDKIPDEVKPEPSSSKYGFTRGDSYYDRREK